MFLFSVIFCNPALGNLYIQSLFRTELQATSKVINVYESVPLVQRAPTPLEALVLLDLPVKQAEGKVHPL